MVLGRDTGGMSRGQKRAQALLAAASTFTGWNDQWHKSSAVGQMGNCKKLDVLGRRERNL